MSVISHYDIRVDGEYGDFFVREEVATTDRELPRHSATFCCYSSYGVLGHYWHSMGSPFATFIRGIDDDYLLGKIAKKVFDEKTCRDSIEAQIAECDKPQAAKAARKALERFMGIYSGEVLCGRIYNCMALRRAGVELSEVTTTVFEPAAQHFVRKLWPAFVAEVNKPH